MITLDDVRDELMGLLDSLDESVIADETERQNVYSAIYVAYTKAMRANA